MALIDGPKNQGPQKSGEPIHRYEKEELMRIHRQMGDRAKERPIGLPFIDGVTTEVDVNGFPKAENQAITPSFKEQSKADQSNWWRPGPRPGQPKNRTKRKGNGF